MPYIIPCLRDVPQLREAHHRYGLLGAWTLERWIAYEAAEPEMRTYGGLRLDDIAVWPVVHAIWCASGRTRYARDDETITEIINHVCGTSEAWRRPEWAFRAAGSRLQQSNLGFALVQSPAFRHVSAVLYDYHAQGLRLPWAYVPWKVRETMKLQSGAHKAPVWIRDGTLAPIPGHFVHISQKDDKSVRFVSDPRKAQRDPPIYTAQKGGRYLRRYYPYLTDHDRQVLVTRMNENAHTLEFATTAEDITAVYNHGPKSCMSYQREKWGNIPCHPVAVYANSDLAVAYLRKGGAVLHKGAEVVARAVVWPERKVWARPYGDHLRLMAALKKAGYRAGGERCFDGAYLPAIPWPDCQHKDAQRRPGKKYVMPYLDNHGPVTVTADGKRLCIGSHEGEGFGNMCGGTNAAGFINITETHKCVNCAAPRADTERLEPIGRVCSLCTAAGAVYFDRCTNTWVRASEHGPMTRVAVGLYIYRDYSGENYIDTQGQMWSQTSVEAHTYMDPRLGLPVDARHNPPVTVHTDRQQWAHPQEPGGDWICETWAEKTARAYAARPRAGGPWIAKNAVLSWKARHAITVKARANAKAEIERLRAIDRKAAEEAAIAAAQRRASVTFTTGPSWTVSNLRRYIMPEDL